VLEALEELTHTLLALVTVVMEVKVVAHRYSLLLLSEVATEAVVMTTAVMVVLAAVAVTVTDMVVLEHLVKVIMEVILLL
tara:strand:- start:324 stop:563 length:240 start_codon:yes stop_codon:yes gene_type:complete